MNTELLPATGFVVKLAVAPDGTPLTDSVTAPA
jgi:hypothetical protein